jgi:hypothetical protein
MRLGAFTDRLSAIGLESNIKHLRRQAHDESARIASGEMSADDATFLMFKGVYYVYCIRYCAAHGIETNGVCPEP